MALNTTTSNASLLWKSAMDAQLKRASGYRLAARATASGETSKPV
jgi:hypothetical protein